MNFKKIYFYFLLLFFFNLITFSQEQNSISTIEYKKIEVNSLEDIKKWKDSDELYAFTKINIDLSKLSPLKRKNTFIDILLPAIKIVNLEIENNKNIVKTLSN